VEAALEDRLVVLGVGQAGVVRLEGDGNEVLEGEVAEGAEVLVAEEQGESLDLEAAAIQVDLVSRGTRDRLVQCKRVVRQRDTGDGERDLEALLGANGLDDARDLVRSKFNQRLRMGDCDSALRVADLAPRGTGKVRRGCGGRGGSGAGEVAV
jgi:hypothetical protein